MTAPVFASIAEVTLKEAFEGTASSAERYELLAAFEKEHLVPLQPEARTLKSLGDLFVGQRLSRHGLLAALQSSQDRYEWPNDRFDLFS